MNVQKMLQSGRVLRLDYGEGIEGNAIIHIREVVDDHQVVSCSWNKLDRCWVYRVDSIFRYEKAFQEGHLRPYRSPAKNGEYQSQNHEKSC